MKRLEENPWWPDLVAKKDSMSLRELAKEFGSTAGSINKALKRNGLERKHAPSGPRTTRSADSAAAKKAAPKKAAPKKVAPKKTAPKKAAAKKVAPKKAAPKAAAPKAAAPKAAAPKTAKRPGPKGLRASTAAKLAPYLGMLGEVADSEIASMAGISIQTVARVRKEKGIAPRRGRGAAAKAVVSNVPRRRPGRPSKITPLEDKLATHSDAEVAAMAGVSENAVRNYRKRHGLAAASVPSPAKAVTKAPNAKAPKAAAPSAVAKAPAAQSVVGQRAYRVQLGDRTAIVVGTNLVEAARKAVESGSEVSSIELLGDILA